MKREFFDLYEEELRHVRERASEFAVDHPEAGGRLSLRGEGAGECPDPFVERLLEGFAFLTARVRLKLEAEYPRFTQGILQTVYPDYLAPWPSAAIVQFTPKWNDGALLKGVEVPRQTALESKRIGEVSCTFRTAHALRLYPLRVEQTQYHWQDLRTLKLGAGRSSAAAFRLRLKMEGVESHQVRDLDCARLAFYVHGQENARPVSELMETLFSQTQSILIAEPASDASAGRTWLGPEALRQIGFDEPEALLPANPRSFEGHRILREHFLLPQRHCFFELTGLAPALSKISGRTVDITFLLEHGRKELEKVLPEHFVQLHCTPAINLFPARAGRVPVGRGQSEFQVLINRARTLDHEVYSIDSVAGFGRASMEPQPFHPFYLQPPHQTGLAGYYTVFRETRRFSEREKQSATQHSHFSRQRTHASSDHYRGSEVFLSIVDGRADPAVPEVDELQIEALCTNRHWPLEIEVGQGPTDFIPRSLAQVNAVKVLAGPTPPRPSFAEGPSAWRAISQLSLNYLSLVDPPSSREKRGVEALRALLRLYSADVASPASRALVEAVRGISGRSGLARPPGGGPIALIRGLDLELTLEDSTHTGLGLFPLASALEQFFARYVSINHFTRLTLHTPQRPKVMTWPARVGRIPVC